MMSKYEEGALLQYADANANKLVVGNAMNPLYLETATDLQDKFKNPYIEFYYWVKGEIYDVQALGDCLEGLNQLRRQKERLEGKKKSNDQTLGKIKSGRTTFKTMFRGEEKKEQIMNEVATEIDTEERDIELYDKIINVVEAHIAKEVIPKFKEEKQQLYYRTVQLVAVFETHNCHLNIGFWRSLISNNNVCSAGLE